jgi:hypothetical protein
MGTAVRHSADCTSQVAVYREILITEPKRGGMLTNLLAVRDGPPTISKAEP